MRFSNLFSSTSPPLPAPHRFSGTRQGLVLLALAFLAVAATSVAALEPPQFRKTYMGRGVNENVPPGSPVGNPVTATGGSGNFTYRLSGTDAALFDLNAATGQITTAAGVSLDHESRSRYAVTVTVTDGDLGVDVTAYISVNVRDVNEPPVIARVGNKTYGRGQPITPITIAANDPDNDLVTVTVSGLPSGLIYADGAVSGTVAAAANPQDYSVTVTANDGTNPAVEATFTITVTAAQLPMFKRAHMGRGVDENVPPGSPVGNPVTAIGGSGNFTYRLSGTDAALFDINTATGQITTAAGVSLDHESRSRYDVTVTVTDGDLGVAVAAHITVNVRDVDEPPVIAQLTNQTYQQGEQIEPIAITASDPDNDVLTVTVTGLPAGLTYASDQVQGTVAEDATPGDHQVTVTANDGVNPDVEVSFTFTVVTVAPPAAPRLARTRFTVESPPALDVTWSAPADDGAVISGYEAQYRKQGAAQWTAYTGTLAANVTHLNLPNLEPGVTYEARVRALRNDAAPGPWSEVGSGQANTPPAFRPGTSGLEDRYILKFCNLACIS